MRLSPKLCSIMQALILPAILLAAFASRLALAVSAFTSTIDTSTVGIMGIRILQGDRPLFYYGQNYMGALEGYGTALMFKLFGVSTTTLTLTPTFFAMGWAAAMYLVFKRMFNRQAGYAAALCVAVPGWYTIWYTMGAYGGYPETYLFGTLAIWICLKLTDSSTPDFSISNTLLLGLLLALGVWTNLQVIPFFIVAAVIAGVHWLLRNRSLRRSLSLGTSGLLGLLGLLPGYYVTKGSEDPGLVTRPTLALVSSNTEIMFDRVLPRLIWWKSTDSPLLKWLIAIAVLIPICFYLASLIRRKIQPFRFIPLLFAIVFLALFLPHSMASLGAPRYMISISVILISAGFSAMLCTHKRMIQTTGWILLATWIGFNGISLAHKCATSTAKKQSKITNRMDVVNRAREQSLNNVMIIGSGVDGLRGLILSLFSKGDINFISCYDDRVYLHSDAWECDDNAAFTFNPGAVHHVTGALSAMSIDSYRVSPGIEYTLLDSIAPTFVEETAIDDLKVILMNGFEGATNAIVDQTASTCIFAKTDRAASFTLDLGSSRTIGAIRLVAVEDDLPQSPYTISTSRDGVTYEQIQATPHRVSQSYQCGNRIYFKGHYAAQDSRFAPVKTRYLRVNYVPKDGRASTWNISEITVFEHLSHATPTPQTEIETLANMIKASSVTFTYSDRWLSRQLEPLLPKTKRKHSVFPTHNTRHPHSELSRTLEVGTDRAIAVANAMAAQSAAILKAHLPESMQLTLQKGEHYSVVTFTSDTHVEPTPLPLIWNGHTVLKQ